MNKEKLRKYKAAWARKKYQKSLKEDAKAARKSKADKNWTRRQTLKDKLFKKLGDKCSNPACQWLNSDGTRGCTDRRCLQIDHVRGDGSKERKGAESYYLKVLNDETGRYQLLCANCNWIKRRVNGEDNARLYKA